MWFKTLACSSLLLVATPAVAGRPTLLTPLVVEGERYFTVEWQTSDTLVYGTIANEFGFAARRIQLLVDSLDATGAVSAQTLVYVPFGLTPGSRSYFEGRVPARAASYRVRVFQWEWLQDAGSADIP